MVWVVVVLGLALAQALVEPSANEIEFSVGSPGGLNLEFYLPLDSEYGLRLQVGGFPPFLFASMGAALSLLYQVPGGDGYIGTGIAYQWVAPCLNFCLPATFGPVVFGVVGWRSSTWFIELSPGIIFPNDGPARLIARFSIGVPIEFR